MLNSFLTDKLSIEVYEKFKQYMCGMINISYTQYNLLLKCKDPIDVTPKCRDQNGVFAIIIIMKKYVNKNTHTHI